MGDRVLYQVVSNGEFSPVIYAHWGGEGARKTVEALRKQMDDRRHDIAYIAARLVEILAAQDPGSDTGLGIWNTDRCLTVEDTHDDAGIVIFDASTFRCKCFGGYLRVDDDGLPFDG